MTRAIETVCRLVLAGLVLAMLVTAASANHDTDCTASGGTNGPAQLDCTLPDFTALEGSTTVLTASFTYTPSVENNPATCAVGTLSVNPPGQWLSLDSNVLDATGPGSADEVTVSVDPSGLTAGVYDGSVLIDLTEGLVAPECPSSGHTNGTVTVRLIVGPLAGAPLLSAPVVLVVVLALSAVGLARIRKIRRSV